MKMGRLIPENRIFLKEILLLVVGPMLCTAMLYFLFRGNNLLYYKIAAYIDLQPAIEYLRTALGADRLHPDYWVTYSLPGALWLLAFQSLMLIIWNKQVNKSSFFWIFTPTLVALGGEFAQFLHITDGTFDLLDVIFYILATVCSFLLYKAKPTYESSFFKTLNDRRRISFMSILFFSVIVIFADVI